MYCISIRRMKRLILFKKISAFPRIIWNTGHEKMEFVVLLQVDYLLTYLLTHSMEQSPS